MNVEYEIPTIEVKLDGITVENHKGGDAKPSDILSGKTAYVDGELITGSIISEEPQPLTFKEPIPMGYHSKGKYFTGDMSYNFDFNTTATASDILKGKTAVCGSKKVMGNIDTCDSYTIELTETQGTFTGLNGKYINCEPSYTMKLNTTCKAENVEKGYDFYDKETNSIETGTLVRMQPFYDIATDNMTSINLNQISSQYYSDTGNRCLSFRPFLFCYSTLSELIEFPAYNSSSGWRYYVFGKNCFDSSDIESLNFNRGSVMDTLGEYCFSECQSLSEVKSEVNGNIVNTVPALPTYCFNNCSYLETVKIGGVGDGNRTIGAYAFSGCTSLSDVYIRNYKSISNYLFTKCINLEKVEFGGQALTTIGNYLLGTGTATTSNINEPITVIFNQTTPPTITTTTFGSVTATTNKLQLNIYVPDSAYNTYTTATNWSAVHQKWGLHKLSELPATTSLEG